MPNEQEQFLKDLETDALDQDPFAYLNGQEPPKEEPKEEEKPPEEDADLKPRNRRERRLEAKLQAERESGIELAARLQALTEAQQARTDTPSEYLSNVERIYGTDSPEAREATELLKQALLSVKEEAKREALEAYEERTSAEAKAVVEAEAVLDDMVAEIEDEFDVDLSSKEAEAHRTNFYRLLEKMSPKDKEGNILYYADPIAVWEVYQERTAPKPDNTARTLASRSMTTGTSTQNSDLTKETTERYLRDQGII